MDQRIYHGTINPEQLAQHLLDTWDRDETIAQALEAEGGLVVQIGQREGGWFNDEPRQAITVGIEQLADGLRVGMGQQQWYKAGGQIMVGGLIGFFPFFFAWPLGNLFRGGDDEIDGSLPGRIWQTIEQFTSQYGAATGPTRRLTTVECPACGVANPQDAAYCSACGTALQPQACPNCGRTNPPGASFCMHCGTALSGDSRAVGRG
ncbi:MAG: zinc ribbon domain-containing protein [Chloroflexaceae bacterium]|jgi:hypothetical protein|nr:zinc ribbon domain-containing protein [Chloroflexaceae bacterium]